MLETITRRFADRHSAGRELAERLSSLATEEPIVLGLARGGVPVAYEVAKALRAPLDVLVVRAGGSEPAHGYAHAATRADRPDRGFRGLARAALRLGHAGAQRRSVSVISSAAP